MKKSIKLNAEEDLLEKLDDEKSEQLTRKVLTIIKEWFLAAGD